MRMANRFVGTLGRNLLESGKSRRHYHPYQRTFFHRQNSHHYYHEYSTLTSSAWSPNNPHCSHPYRQGDDETSQQQRQRQKFQLVQYQQQRQFLIPLVFVGVGVAGAWVLYRKSQGKPMASDKALEAQEKYKQQMQDLQQRQTTFTTQHQKTAADNNNSDESQKTKDGKDDKT